MTSRQVSHLVHALTATTDLSLSQSFTATVYLLDEITELASVGGETAQGMADATIKRLGNRSPIVKQKVQTLHLVPSC